MGSVIDTAKDVVDTIIDVVSEVVDIVEDIVSEVANFLGLKEIELMIIIIVIYTICTADFTQLSTLLAAENAALVAAELTYYELTVLTIQVFIEAVVLSFNNFLVAIHFSTLLSVHTIA
ncbi:unnamed protein product, partial [marine sediment metagenome]